VNFYDCVYSGVQKFETTLKIWAVQIYEDPGLFFFDQNTLDTAL